MRKHTIRQWHVDPSDDLDAPRVLDHAGAVVAVLPEGSNDARLIAAAPDLLEALLMVLEIGLADEDGAGQVEDAIYAAIAKAEGRS